MIDIINPSICQITSAFLTTHDGTSYSISDIITEFSMIQSIESAGLRGSISILDTIGFLEDVPLRGEEQLNITLLGADLNTSKVLNLQIYRIDNVSIKDNNDGLSYVLHFVSQISYKASLRRIIEPHENIVSEIVKILFAKYFAPITPTPLTNTILSTEYFTVDAYKGFYVQPTEGMFRCVIPHYEANEAMYFLVTRSYSSDSPSCSFRFFEDTDNYNFVTDEFLINNAIKNDRIRKFTYKVITDKNPDNISEQIYNLKTIQNTNRVDTSSDLYSGAYTNNVTEIDFLRKKVSYKRFNYLTDSKYIAMDGTTNKPDSLHSTQFIKDTFNTENEKHFFVFKDYASKGDIPGQLRSEQFVPEIVSNRVAYNHHLNNTILSAQISGRLDIKAGDLANLDIKEFVSTNDRKQNKQLSGNYLVHTVNHSVKKDILTTTMKLVKYDWSV